jgi:copper chaperone CopZ
MRRNPSGDPRLVVWAAVLVGLAAVGAVTGACGTGDAEVTDRADRDEPAAAPLITAEFDVEGMTCGGCALATEAALRKLDGVAAADAEYDARTKEGRCTVEYDPARVNSEQMLAAIRDLGYEPTLRDPEG